MRSDAENIKKNIGKIIDEAKNERWFPLKETDSKAFEIIDVYSIREDEETPILLIISAKNKRVNMILDTGKNGYSDSIKSGRISKLLDSVIDSSYHGKMEYNGRKDRLRESLKNIRPINANQSNTSFILNDKIIGKFMRTYSDVENPDFMLPWKLWKETDFRDIPEPIGQVSYKNEQCLITFSEYCKGSKDYWAYLMEADNPGDVWGSLGKIAEELAVITAKMHVSLSKLSGVDFAPEKFTYEDIEKMKFSLSEFSEKLIKMCKRLGNKNEYARNILEHQDRLVSVVKLLDKLPQSGLNKQRIHGDYHLGQILKTEIGPKVIDFEGEPLRNAGERKQKQSPMKDVAGIMRSFDYLCCSKLGQLNSRSENIQENFLNSYIRERKLLDSNFSKDSEFFREILPIFLMEKAIYESIYEMENRPDWINIPLGYISNLAY